MRKKPLVCLYEDRPSQIAGLKLLLLSLSGFCPDWPILLNFPNLPSSLRYWLGRIPGLQLTSVPFAGCGSYNVKPQVLAAGLATGADRCVWLDTDVLVRAPIANLFDLPADTLLVTEDPWVYSGGSSYRAHVWGLPPGRSLQGPMNTGVVSVTQEHTALLAAWQRLMSKEWYVAEQKLPVDERNRLALGDQDVLSALLASEEFAAVPLELLRHGSEILHHHGAGAFAGAERWKCVLHGIPPLLHAMGSTKPWLMQHRPQLCKAPRAYYERYYLEMSPYVHLARTYRSLMDEDCSWMDVQTAPGRLSAMLLRVHPALAGVSQAVLHRLNHTRQQSRVFLPCVENGGAASC
jgi:hypothetical protein